MAYRKSTSRLACLVYNCYNLILIMAKRISGFKKFTNFKNLKLKVKKLLKRCGEIIDRRPLTSFFVVLAVIFLLIVVGSFLRKPKQEATIAKQVKEVATYSIGSAPTINVQAQIEKSGVIKVEAQTPGIVSLINVTEGQKVTKGTVLVGLSSNYQGGNAAGAAVRMYEKESNRKVVTSENFLKQIEDAQKPLPIPDKVKEDD